MTRDLSMEITLFVEFSLKVYTYILIVKDKYYDDYNFYVIIILILCFMFIIVVFATINPDNISPLFISIEGHMMRL